MMHINGRLLWVGFAMIAIVAACSETEKTAEPVVKPMNPPATYDCRPIGDGPVVAGAPLRLPCTRTVEACDGVDNDGDGIVDPHCPTVSCLSNADCTFQGLVPDAVCVDEGGSSLPHCAPIDTVPESVDSSACWGVLCPPGRKCIGGDCVWPGVITPEALCGAGEECPLNAGCIRGEDWIQTPEYEVGTCRQYCHDFPCPVGHVCLPPNPNAPVQSAICTPDFVCYAAQQSGECQMELDACVGDPGCQPLHACVTNRLSTVTQDASGIPVEQWLGAPDAAVNACWNVVAGNETALELKACLEFSCTLCLNCTDKECGPDGCGGTCGTCAEGTTCSDDIQSPDLGTLPQGVCMCLPDCQDKDCGDDGCGGDCGECGPGTACLSGICECAPTCEGKQCGVDGCGQPCGTCEKGLTCSDDGQCVCVPDCAIKNCGDDGCGGSCGTCDQEGAICSLAGVCICLPSCTGKVCGVDGCGNSCGTCPGNQTCDLEGQCGCYPECDEKQCGVDGCGNSCGTCPGTQVCDEDGKCGCYPECGEKQCGVDGCGNSCGTCPTGQTCSEDGACGCFPECGEKQCGVDGCGNSCGTCTDDLVCSDDGICECIPDCFEKMCGLDGCGGSCGVCSQGEQCDPQQQCQCLDGCGEKACGEDACGNVCGVCPDGATCNGAGVCECTPDCTNKDCGDDGCGGECGTCGAGEVCSVNGECTVSAGSCAGLCGAPVDGAGCKCDASCFTFNDCCADICSVCSVDFESQCAS